MSPVPPVKVVYFLPAAVPIKTPVVSDPQEAPPTQVLTPPVVIKSPAS